MNVCWFDCVPLAQVELPSLLRRGGVDADRRKLSDVVRSPARIDDVNGLLTAVETVFDEREQDPIVVVAAVEKSADVTMPAQRCPADPDRSTTNRLLDRCVR